jgi:hypothetical protein
MSKFADRMRKIQGLLKKAESTEFEAEADAFMAKAHEIMADMAIDEAQVREAMTEAERAHTKRPIQVDFEYSTTDSNARGKRNLLFGIARASRVQMINRSDWSGRGVAKRMGIADNVASQWVSFVGYEEDIERVKILYASLLIQSQRFGMIDFRTKNYEGLKQSRFLTAYMVGFADTIRRRLQELNREAFVGETNALIVRTDAEVNSAFDDFFKHRRSHRERPVASGAYRSGQAGGHKADIGRPSVGGSRRQIGG